MPSFTFVLESSFFTFSAPVSVFNDGSSRDLMSLTGTIPISYRGSKKIISFTSKSHNILSDFMIVFL